MNWTPMQNAAKRANQNKRQAPNKTKQRKWDKFGLDMPRVTKSRQKRTLPTTGFYMWKQKLDMIILFILPLAYGLHVLLYARPGTSDIKHQPAGTYPSDLQKYMYDL